MRLWRGLVGFWRDEVSPAPHEFLAAFLLVLAGLLACVAVTQALLP